MRARRNGDEALREAQKRVLKELTPENVFALARIYERLGMTDGRRVTTVAVEREGPPAILTFAHDPSFTPDRVRELMADAIRARFASPAHQVWLETHGNLNWTMGAAIPAEAFLPFGLELIDRVSAELRIDGREIVVYAPAAPDEAIDVELELSLSDRVRFNAIQWFRRASSAELEQLARDEWVGSMLDVIGGLVRFCAESNPRLADVVARIPENLINSQIVTIVDEDQARTWVHDNRPELDLPGDEEYFER